MSAIETGLRQLLLIVYSVHMDAEFVDAKGGVKKEAAIGARFTDEFPEGNIEELLQSIQTTVISYAKKNKLKIPAQAAFNNARGDWLELILAAHFWNAVIDRNIDMLVLRLPNVAKMEFIKIFDEEAQERIQSGLMRTLEEHDARLDMSNPDLIGVRIDRSSLPPEFHKRLDRLGAADAHMLFDAYKHLIGKCPYNSILFGISIKTSLRGDRRYQIVHEGSIVKAFIAHLQTRYWDTSFETKFYGAVTDNVSDNDHEIFRTAATHSIVNVFSPSVRAVDKVYHVPTTNDVNDMIKKIINAASTAPQLNKAS
ncbi:MAG: BsrFI restriction endonuclease [Candidatus Peribacteria bacterium GW2011_GWB1_54_5]|nr:MAG: BsrFI restriction endonuclease [Candidatus Peribacteria bacterium GW2011_GWB1_54_5]KKW38558.1 MAG: BsrFI restriction endonuclease [Candidatus Peribacteria bacterium GW2011_GWC2_54_8]KKW41122.1 MAG: BsrFI restriction endonuclease [Candidatus Peregrinibacteria bacterium GW2011_GWA2_54_9]